MNKRCVFTSKNISLYILSLLLILPSESLTAGRKSSSRDNEPRQQDNTSRDDEERDRERARERAESEAREENARRAAQRDEDERQRAYTQAIEDEYRSSRNNSSRDDDEPRQDNSRREDEDRQRAMAYAIAAEEDARRSSRDDEENYRRNKAKEEEEDKIRDEDYQKRKKEREEQDKARALAFIKMLSDSTLGTNKELSNELPEATKGKKVFIPTKEFYDQNKKMFDSCKEYNGYEIFIPSCFNQKTTTQKVTDYTLNLLPSWLGGRPAAVHAAAAAPAVIAAVQPLVVELVTLGTIAIGKMFILDSDPEQQQKDIIYAQEAHKQEMQAQAKKEQEITKNLHIDYEIPGKPKQPVVAVPQVPVVIPVPKTPTVLTGDIIKDGQIIQRNQQQKIEDWCKDQNKMYADRQSKLINGGAVVAYNILDAWQNKRKQAEKNAALAKELKEHEEEEARRTVQYYKDHGISCHQYVGKIGKNIDTLEDGEALQIIKIMRENVLNGSPDYKRSHDLYLFFEEHSEYEIHERVNMDTPGFMKARYGEDPIIYTDSILYRGNVTESYDSYMRRIQNKAVDRENQRKINEQQKELRDQDEILSDFTKPLDKLLKKAADDEEAERIAELKKARKPKKNANADAEEEPKPKERKGIKKDVDTSKLSEEEKAKLRITGLDVPNVGKHHPNSKGDIGKSHDEGQETLNIAIPFGNKEKIAVEGENVIVFKPERTDSQGITHYHGYIAGKVKDIKKEEIKRVLRKGGFKVK